MKPMLIDILLLIAMSPSLFLDEAKANRYLDTPRDALHSVNPRPRGSMRHDLNAWGNLTVQRLNSQSTRIRDDETHTIPFIQTVSGPRTPSLIQAGSAEGLDLEIQE